MLCHAVSCQFDHFKFQISCGHLVIVSISAIKLVLFRNILISISLFYQSRGLTAIERRKQVRNWEFIFIFYTMYDILHCNWVNSIVLEIFRWYGLFWLQNLKIAQTWVHVFLAINLWYCQLYATGGTIHLWFPSDFISCVTFHWNKQMKLY